MSQAELSFLAAAEATARWIRSHTQAAAHGLTWLPDPDQPNLSATVSAPATIYSGNAGIVLFFLELARATGDTSYLIDAQRGADQIAATWREVLNFQFLIKLDHVNLDFNHGLSGTAFTLAQVWLATHDTRYRDSALAITHYIVDQARPAVEGVEWTGAAAAALGDGAIILYLLWAAHTFADSSLRDLAKRAGERILSAAERDEHGNLKWVGFPLEQNLGAPAGAYMPNFEFGTAGVAYVLARLFAETGDQRFLDAAESGARHVESISTTDGQSALLYLRAPDQTDLFYLGYCGGPVGTTRLFYELHQITHADEYRDWTARFANGIMTSGIPEQRTPGLWNVVCQCCGTAGIIDFFTSLWIANSRPEYLAFAKRVAAHTLSHASDPDGKGLRWYQAWTRVRPDVIAAETGYMIGAAGVGSAFLHLYLAERGQYNAILFPDNPFPAQSERQEVSV